MMLGTADRTGLHRHESLSLANLNIKTNETSTSQTRTRLLALENACIGEYPHKYSQLGFK